jgi:hypothetical protein
VTGYWILLIPHRPSGSWQIGTDITEGEALTSVAAELTPLFSTHRQEHWSISAGSVSDD